MPSVRDLITDILQDLNVVGSGQTPKDADMQFVLRRANRWIDSLALENLAMYFVLRTQHTLTSGTPSYTVGTGGDINITRPDHFERAGLILDIAGSPLTEIPVDLITDQQWQRISVKELESPLARGIWYDRANVSGRGRIYPWPVPNVGNTAIVLYNLARLERFTSLAQEIEYPPGYELFLETNLLRFVAPAFGKAVTPDQHAEANRARAIVKRANIRPVQIGVDPALVDYRRAGAFDIRTGDFW